jgi:hypothetical protein
MGPRVTHTRAMSLRNVVKLMAISVIRCDMMSEPLRNELDVAVESAPWSWSSCLDALVAAPRHHRLMYENERVRVLEVRIPRGNLVPVHAHRWPAVLHLQSWSEHLRRDQAGKLVFDSRESGPTPEIPSVVWCPPLPPHSVENIGEAELLVLSIELKDAVGTRQLIR